MERPIQRLIANTTTNCLWPYILALLKTEPVYAYLIQDMVKERFGFEVGQVTAYMVLYKLESNGYVQTEWRSVENRQRKYYKITPIGSKALEDSIDYLAKTAQKLGK
ncbi:MAG: PadR family transcriptional regulator [Candidatus Altiarchaeota archaeon]